MPRSARDRAKSLGLNLAVEREHTAAIREAEQRRGLSETEQAIAGYNAFVERHGVFGDEHRGF